MYFWLLDEEGNEIVASAYPNDILKALDELVDRYNIMDYTIEAEFVREDHTALNRTFTLEDFVDFYMPL